jgi:hypothetical protein
MQVSFQGYWVCLHGLMYVHYHLYAHLALSVVQYKYSTAKAWAPLAQELLHYYGDDVPDTI